MPDTYTIHMRDETFYLTSDQIEFDSPNYFTTCFLGDFAESQTRTVRLSRDPDLFKIVLDYLSGYRVLPLHDSTIPKRMDRGLALQNLRVDAEFYLLDGLVAQLKNSEEKPPATISAISEYVIMSCKFTRNEAYPLSWGPPAYIDTDSAAGLQSKYGFDVPLQYCWNAHHSRIQESLNKARIERQFLLHASWEEKRSSLMYCVVLRLA